MKRGLWLLAATVAAAAGGACTGGGGGGSPTGTPTPTGNVVRVLDSNGAPMPAITVVVNDSAGEIAATTETGTDGTVSIEIPAGGSVTVLDVANGQHEAQTVLEPPTGITLGFVVAVTPTPAATPETTTLELTLTAPGNVTAVHLYANCNVVPAIPYPPGGTVQTTVDSCSPAQAGWGFLAIGRDSSNAPVAWTKLLGQPNTFGGTLPLTLDLSANTAFDTVAVGHAALPASAESHAVFTWTADPEGFIRLTAIPYSPALPATASPVSTSVPVPSGAAVAWSPSVEALILNANSTSTFLRQEWKVAGNALASEYLLDPAGRSLVAIGFLDTTDPSRPGVSWTPGAGTRGVAGFASVRWSTGGAFAERRFVFPGGAPESVRFPKLPATATEWTPDGTSVWLKWTAGYDDVDAIPDFAAYLTTDRATLPAYVRFVSSGSAP